MGNHGFFIVLLGGANCQLFIIFASNFSSMETRILPVGIQSFETMRKGSSEYLYIDKTALVYKMVSKDCPFFLSRPRGFGKSLLVNTIKAYFEGRKDLFEGLAMEMKEKYWTVYPVLTFDLSTAKYSETEKLHYALNALLKTYERQYGITDDSVFYGVRLSNLIEKAYNETGRKVVILIDEYDAPMLDSIGDEEKQKAIRNTMRDFFSPLKAQANKLRFVFLTGITKFSQLSIFSELNNLRNISMDDEFSSICGISKEELLTQMQPEIESLAKANGETYEEACEHLRRQYDGYHFSANGEDIYNPFSIVNVLTCKRYDNFWFSTGTPTFLLELMRKQNIEILDLNNLSVTSRSFDAPTDFKPSLISVLYQSGYLTIKDYNRIGNLYRLDFPNYEVKSGFSDSLVQYYGRDYSNKRDSLQARFFYNLMEDKVDAFLTEMKDFLKGFPYNLGMNCGEMHYQTIVYSVLISIGMDVHAEVSVAEGRIDMAVSFPHTNYLFEFKLNKTAQEALDQINENNYAACFSGDSRKIIKVGVNFSTQTRTIDDWVVE